MHPEDLELCWPVRRKVRLSKGLHSHGGESWTARVLMNDDLKFRGHEVWAKQATLVVPQSLRSLADAVMKRYDVLQEELKAPAKTVRSVSKQMSEDWGDHPNFYTPNCYRVDFLLPDMVVDVILPCTSSAACQKLSPRSAMGTSMIHHSMFSVFVAPNPYLS